MRQDPLLDSIGGMLRRFKRAEAWLRNAGLPTVLARIPVWLLCLQYCVMMRAKTARITRIAERIARWHETIAELAQHEKARTELIDMDNGMRNDIESTKRTLLQLRELSVDVGAMFSSIGFTSVMLDRTQNTFVNVVDDACDTATSLQQALETHDTRALALLRQLHDAERSVGLDAKNKAKDQAGLAATPNGDVGGHATQNATSNTVSETVVHRESGTLPIGTAADPVKA